MSDSKVLAEAKRRIEEVETALLMTLDQALSSAAVRAWLLAELGKALEDYCLLVSGQPQKRTPNNFLN